MRAGRLTRLIEVQRRTDTVNDYGTPAPVWRPHARLRAEIVQQSTEEFMRAQGVTDEAVRVFRTRWHADVTTADRIRFDGQSFNIKEVVEIGRRQGLELRAEEVT